VPNSRENVLIETVLVLLNQIGDVTLSNLEVLKMWAKQPISCQIAHQEIDPKDTVDTDVAPVSKSPSMNSRPVQVVLACCDWVIVGTPPGNESISHLRKKETH